MIPSVTADFRAGASAADITKNLTVSVGWQDDSLESGISGFLVSQKIQITATEVDFDLGDTHVYRNAYTFAFPALAKFYQTDEYIDDGDPALGFVQGYYGAFDPLGKSFLFNGDTVLPIQIPWGDWGYDETLGAYNSKETAFLALVDAWISNLINDRALGDYGYTAYSTGLEIGNVIVHLDPVDSTATNASFIYQTDSSIYEFPTSGAKTTDVSAAKLTVEL